MLVVGGIAGVIGEPVVQAGNLLSGKPLFSSSYYATLWGAVVDLHKSYYGNIGKLMNKQNPGK
jgi:hypothetical protein